MSPSQKDDNATRPKPPLTKKERKVSGKVTKKPTKTNDLAVEKTYTATKESRTRKNGQDLRSAGNNSFGKHTEPLTQRTGKTKQAAKLNLKIQIR